MKGKKVAVGLSGGVDSSVAAALLIEQGYEVHGIYLECYNEPGCRTDQDKKDALQVAMKLGISFEVIDFRREYHEKVVEYFYHEYEVGRTPNPDVMCNKEIKFGIFYDWAMQNGYDYVATGHYARIANVIQSSSNPVFQLMRAKDESKDQSYFLWQIPQDHLEHILFPLGQMLKSEVRAKAKAMGLVTASKPDSMGICFIGEVNVNKLLKDKLGENPGEVIINSTVVGKHSGLWFYTIGERGGFEIDKQKLKKLGLHPEKMKPLYVIGKNTLKNELIVGMREETMTNKIEVNSQIINSQILKLKTKLWVRIRNLGELVEVDKISGNTVILREKIFGVAEGQSAVFYDETGILVGGSIIV
ncbi:MAG: tRNA 2-thiouridine(34) synthase MnmA [bacterium]